MEPISTSHSPRTHLESDLRPTPLLAAVYAAWAPELRLAGLPASVHTGKGRSLAQNGATAALGAAQS